MPLYGQDTIKNLSKNLEKVPHNTRQEVRGALLKAGQLVVTEAKARSAWSTRIPGAISTTARITGSKPGVIIRVSQAKAPHARPYEGITQGATFRHPVFFVSDKRNVWVTQQTRPFLFRAVGTQREAVKDQIASAVLRALNNVGGTSA